MTQAPDSIAILADLIAFPTVSADPNRALIDYAAGMLRALGAEVRILPDPSGHKANLFATIGPADRPGVMLSGHTDVVPVEGQDWTVPPFELTERDGKLFGRGAADMKGFVACALRAAHLAAQAPLVTPLHLALSYDEELGCLGVHSLIEMLAAAPVRPALCIVGEPTGQAVATGHKGKTAIRATCTGREAHSALAPTGLNAVYLACDMIAAIRAEQARLIATGPQDAEYDVPYTTLHVGRIEGGTALNIVPNHCGFAFEIRNLAGDDPEAILTRLRAEAEAILAPLRPDVPEAAITLDVFNSYPPLATAPGAEVVRFVKSLTGANGTMKVAFGTEGGLFDTRLGLPTVICGPGSMAQGHKPDEYVSRDQMAGCDAMLAELVRRLRIGLA